MSIPPTASMLDLLLLSRAKTVRELGNVESQYSRVKNEVRARLWHVRANDTINITNPYCRDESGNPGVAAGNQASQKSQGARAIEIMN